MKRAHILSLMPIIAGISALSGVSVSTDPVGAMKITLPAQSDTTLSLPLHQPASYRGAVASVDAVNNTVTLAGTPDWTADQFANPNEPHYLLLDAGVDEGMAVTVLSNTANTLTVELGTGDTLANIEAGDPVSIIPHWTVGAVFGDVEGLPNGTQIFLYDNNVAGQNFSSSSSLIHFSGNWFQSGVPANNVIFFPNETFIVRAPSGDDIDLVLSGCVPMTKNRAIIRTIQAGVNQDQRVSFNSPVEVVVGEAGFPAVAGDQIFIYNNDARVVNKSAADALIYFGGSWFRSGVNVTNTYTLSPATGIVYRKAATAEPEDLIWQALPAYLSE